jgi:hypothetical protein
MNTSPEPFDFGAYLARELVGSPFDPNGNGPLQLATSGQVLTGEVSTADVRRRRARRSDLGVHTATLIQSDGMLHWEFGHGVPPRRMRAAPRRAGGRASTPADDVLPRRVMQRLRFTDLPRNEVANVLTKTDGWLTPKQGLFQVQPDLALSSSTVRPLKEGRILLLVHGTFSNVETTLTEIGKATTGSQFLRRALSQYKQVLAFNHPTLSVSALLNAAELARTFRDSRATVDIICHSRGGLVSRWYREAFEAGQRPAGKTVYVGSPLAGTGLAAPAKLKRSIDLLTNYASAMRECSEKTGAFLPLAGPISVLMSLLGTVFRVATSGPLDAGISLVPGLTSQARQGLNAEILSLRAGLGPPGPVTPASIANYYFVTSNFEPNDPGWKFWEYFRNIRDRLRNVVMDGIFEGENDLVVDTASMTDLTDLGVSLEPRQVRSFGTTPTVHHNNYFQQPETIAFFREVLGV